MDRFRMAGVSLDKQRILKHPYRIKFERSTHGIEARSAEIRTDAEGSSET
jgi:hypothetical protein